LASIADTHDRKTGILLGIGLFTVGSGHGGHLADLLGIHPWHQPGDAGKWVFIPSVNAYLGDRIPYEKRGRVIAIPGNQLGAGFHHRHPDGAGFNRILSAG
jgi:hypothetical protein